MEEVQQLCPPFYLNVNLLNKDDVVKQKAGEKLGKGIFGKAVSSVASAVINDESVISKVVDQLEAKLEKVTSDMGIMCDIARRYSKGTYICLKVEIKDIDKMTLIAAAKGVEYQKKFVALLSALEELGLGEKAIPKIDEKIAAQVHSNIMLKFQEQIPLKLAEQGVICEINVIDSKFQADFFFNVLESMGK